MSRPTRSQPDRRNGPGRLSNEPRTPVDWPGDHERSRDNRSDPRILPHQRLPGRTIPAGAPPRQLGPHPPRPPRPLGQQLPIARLPPHHLVQRSREDTTAVLTTQRAHPATSTCRGHTTSRPLSTRPSTIDPRTPKTATPGGGMTSRTLMPRIVLPLCRAALGVSGWGMPSPIGGRLPCMWLHPRRRVVIGRWRPCLFRRGVRRPPG